VKYLFFENKLKFVQENDKINNKNEVWKSMKNLLYDHGYHSDWTDVYVERRERYQTSVTDFHEHDFYEINLIMSGNVRVLVSDRTVEGTDNMIVLAKPDTSHYVSCKPDVLYTSLFLVFSEKFIKSYDIESMNLLSVFGEHGTILTITSEEKHSLANIINFISEEESSLRKRFLVFYLLSCIDDISRKHSSNAKIIPKPIFEVLTYINKHYMEKIVAGKLADMMYMGRTTLMTQFKKHTGKTLHEYVVNCRLRNAIKLLMEGKTEYEAAISSGFSDASSFIQCFKREFKLTPLQYIKNI